MSPLVDSLRLRERLREAARALHAAERPIRVLRSLAWPAALRAQFFADGATKLPRPVYPGFDPAPTLAATREARRPLTGDTPAEAWLRRVADSLDASARMLAGAGTAAFYQHSRTLYGAPGERLPDGLGTPLALARRLDALLAGFDHEDLGSPPDACHLADAMARHLRAGVETFLGAQGPVVEVVDDASANVIAGPRRIRVRRQACFTDLDLQQLLHHEVLVHVAIALNGRAQPDLPILGAAHAGTTRTQEGLAVFAELFTGALDVRRIRQLAQRVIAIHLVEDGADFIELYRHLLERASTPDQAFETARRVFRGGVITGGAPFTKDAVYLDGLIRVHHFLRAAVVADRLDYLRALFCGKVDLEDTPAMVQLLDLGLCRPPRHLPPWASDLRSLVAHLAFTNALTHVDADGLDAHYAGFFSRG